MPEHDCGLFAPECPGRTADQHATALNSAIRAIAHGGIDGPTGIEALAMAITGPGGNFDNNLVAAIGESGDAVATALNNVADALGEIATALTKQSTERNT